MSLDRIVVVGFTMFFIVCITSTILIIYSILTFDIEQKRVPLKNEKIDYYNSYKKDYTR